MYLITILFQKENLFIKNTDLQSLDFFRSNFWGVGTIHSLSVFFCNKDKYSKMIYSPAFKRIKNVRSNKDFQYHNY